MSGVLFLEEELSTPLLTTVVWVTGNPPRLAFASDEERALVEETTLSAVMVGGVALP